MKIISILPLTVPFVKRLLEPALRDLDLVLPIFLLFFDGLSFPLPASTTCLGKRPEALNWLVASAGLAASILPSVTSLFALIAEYSNNGILTNGVRGG